MVKMTEEVPGDEGPWPAKEIEVTLTKHTPGPWQWEYNASSKSVTLVGGKPRFDKLVMDFARWGMNRATPMFNEAITDPHGWHIMSRLCDRPTWRAPILGREHHASWCQAVTHPDAVLMARAPTLLAALENVRALAARHRTEEWAEHMLRFCAAADVTGSPFRAAGLSENA